MDDNSNIIIYTNILINYISIRIFHYKYTYYIIYVCIIYTFLILLYFNNIILL